MLTPVFLLAIAGCGSASKTSTPAHAIAATGTTCSKRSSDDIKECIVTLSDTRQVVCVVYAGYQMGGLSCRLGPCERRGQGAGKMSYNVVTRQGVRTFENIDDAGDYAQAVSLRTGEPVKVFHAETGLAAFTTRTKKETK